MTTIIAKTITKAAVPIILLTSFALLFQGHNLPGGGFIGGVLTAVAFSLVYIIFGIDYLEEKIMQEKEAGSSYRRLFTAGLAVAAASGIVAVFYGLPFLTQDFWIFHIPVYSELHIASALAFDMGVYLVVVGALLTVVSEVGAE